LKFTILLRGKNKNKSEKLSEKAAVKKPLIEIMILQTLGGMRLSENNDSHNPVNHDSNVVVIKNGVIVTNKNKVDMYKKNFPGKGLKATPQNKRSKRLQIKKKIKEKNLKKKKKRKKKKKIKLKQKRKRKQKKRR